MNEHTAVNLPAGVAETLNCLELVPFRSLCVIDFHRHVFANIICPSTNYHHQRAEEQSRMLVARRWGHFILVWRLDPVPATVSMPSETPSVCKTTLISGATTKTDHHAGRTPYLAKGRRVIDSCCWLLFARVQFVPAEWSTLNTQAPNVIDWLLSCIAAIDK